MACSRIFLVALLKRIALAYIVICAALWCLQRQLIYMPQAQAGEPATYGLKDFKEIQLTDADGTPIAGWAHGAREGFPTIVYFHGNGGNLGHRANYFRQLAGDGFGLVAIDYRGYGNSHGSPSEQGFYQDARAAIDYSTHVLSLPPGRLIVYGESIGTGVAIQMATEYAFGAVVLQSPYTSLVALGQAQYPWVPVSLLQTDRFDSLSKIGQVHAPILAMHGQRDGIVPSAHSKELLDHAKAPSQLIYYPGKGHVDLDTKVMAQAVVDFSREHGLIEKTKVTQ